jgi:hypothetical protein
MLRIVTPRTPSYAGCGEGSEVIEQSSVEHNGATIGIMSSTCPPSGSPDKSKRAAGEPEKRAPLGNCEGYPDLTLCRLTVTNCTGSPVCENVFTPVFNPYDVAINPADCVYVIEVLESYGTPLGLYSVFFVLMIALHYLTTTSFWITSWRFRTTS